MKKFIIFSLFVFKIGFAQDTIIKSELPTIIPPSPTIAALMKFEEVPVSHYSGLPEISIPIFNFKTISKDVNIGLNLNYHPSSIAYDEIAGDVGLGWSLSASNAISRTVRGLPDELFLMGGQGTARIGIYYNSTPFHINDFYKVEKYLKNEMAYGAYYDEFIYNTNLSQSLDNEHDLYQFNFFGKSGRFIIRKNINGILEIVRLDSDKKIKIELNYTFQNGIYSINSFTAFDDKGIKYVFDVIENTTFSQMNENTYLNNQTSMNINRNFSAKSAFNLSKVIDNNNKEILSYNYEVFNEKISTGTIISYFPNNIRTETNEFFYSSTNPYWADFNFKQLGPSFVTSISQRTITSSKISTIEVKNFGNIIFEYEAGRLDSKIINGAAAVKLKGIKIFDNYTNLIKEFNLNYFYREHNSAGIDVKRMFLSSLVEKNSMDIRENIHKFYYQDNNSFGKEISKDYWGYFNLIPIMGSGGFYREVRPDFVTTDVLNKIEYPTGGVRVFNFESSTYSFEGQTEINSYDANPDNWRNYSAYKNFNSINNNLTSFFTVENYASEVNFSTQIGFPTNDWWFRIYKDVKSSSTKVASISSYSAFNQNGYVSVPDLLPGNYLVEFTINDRPFGITNYNASISVHYKAKVSSNNYKNFLYGGGIRIKNIQSFENILLSNAFGSEPSEQTDFIYTLESNHTKSSGSLVFPKPKFEYNIYKTIHLKSGLSVSNNNFLINDSFKVRSTANNLFHIRTQGSDVGYKNVQVIKKSTNSSNGSIKYEFTSPIDFPEVLTEKNLNYPFLPTSNLDYKRGLLSKQSYYDKSGNILKEVSNNYIFTNESLYVTGIKSYDVNNCPFSYLYPTYYNYNTFLQNCLSNNNCNYPLRNTNFSNDPKNLTCLYVPSFIQSSLLYTAIGLPLLQSTITKNFIYSNQTNNPSIIEQFETYTYNSNNLISSKSMSNSLGENLVENYNYHYSNSIYSKNRISEIERIETYRASELLSKSQIIYNNNWTNNVSFLPQTIQTAKGSEGYENRLQYLNYDEFGNPLEVKQEGGIHICYIWGYNKTQPIAKIENATYNDIQPFEANLQALSNGTDEQGLITALNNLRTALPNAMITTYTYKPLIGISTITDPKGDKQTYHYDSFNRLQFVKDAQGNILSENQYHYRTQN